ncbi:hypothetical protein HDU76_010738 [Blyttiomyces sp. JEL0837]|nr:hypothetical protein HDU76_010738 [Blyttiomyces sp. JEL0837]
MDNQEITLYPDYESMEFSASRRDVSDSRPQSELNINPCTNDNSKYLSNSNYPERIFAIPGQMDEWFCHLTSTLTSTISKTKTAVEESNSQIAHALSNVDSPQPDSDTTCDVVPPPIVRPPYSWARLSWCTTHRSSTLQLGQVSQQQEDRYKEDAKEQIKEYLDSAGAPPVVPPLYAYAKFHISPMMKARLE